MSPASFDRPKIYQSDQPSVGQVLRTRREELGWEIETVANTLCIRPRLLLALEADDLNAFPGVIYAIGFLRSYGQILHLDAEALVERLKREAPGKVARKTELVFPQPQDDRNVPLGVLIGAGLIVVVAAYAGWYRFTAHDVPAERKVPAVAELMSGAATPLTTSPQVASVMPGNAPSSHGVVTHKDLPVVAGPEIEKPTTLPVSTPESVPETLHPPVQGAGLATVAGSGTSVAEGKEGSISSPSAPDDHAGQASDQGVRVQAQASVWTQIRNHDGQVVLGRVLQPGENWQGNEGDAPFVMSFGNAGGVILSSGGVTSAPLGRDGAVRRNVTVTPQAIRSGAFGTGAVSPVPASKPVPASPASASSFPAVVTVPVPHPHRSGASTPASPSSKLSADDLNARQLDQSSASH